MIEIDGFKCYSPDLATQNYGFNANSFEMLFNVEDKSFWFTNKNNVIQELLKNFLEIGCGSAFVINHLNKKYPELDFTCSEIYIEGLKLARSRVSRKFL